jgi:hypothetical protein
LRLGLAEYRNQNTAEALTKFREAQNAYDLRHAGTAFAWASLAEWQLGRHADARQSLASARQIFDEFLEGNHGDLGRQWIHTAIFEIALREAEQVIGDSTPGRGAEGANPRQ